MGFVRAGRRWGRALLDMVMPPQCLCCDAEVADPGLFCASCFAGLRFITAPCCDRCGTALERAPRVGTPLCDACQEDPPPWSRARAVFLYDERSRRLILPLKHADRTELAAPLGRLMARAGGVLLTPDCLLVPVPLHPRRLRGRRYNQAGLLAHAIARTARVPVLIDALVRTRATLALAALSAEQRESMVRDAFALRRGRAAVIAGRRVVLVDDVLTSGATARACTRILRDAGARSVDILVAARTADPRNL